MSDYRRHLGHILEINIAMLFISTSGVLGKYISLPVPVTICLRAAFALLALWIFCKLKGISFAVLRKDRFLIGLTGIFMGVHWITYFYALQWSNVAIGMLSLFSYPVITSFLEPFFLKTTFQKSHILLGFLVLCGIYFLVPDFNVENSHTIAVGMGILSAVAYSVRNLILKAKVEQYNGSMLMCYQTGIVTVFLLPFVFLIPQPEDVLQQWQALVVLAVITTAIGHTLYLTSFKHFSITTVSILGSVQPVYGIIIGAFFLKEIPSWSTILGGLLILSSVIIESIRSFKKA